MTTRIGVLQRPAAGADYRSPSKYRSLGVLLAFLGLMLAVVTLILNIVAGNLSDEVDKARTLAVSFGLTTFSFATIKLGVAVVLIGIIVRLWIRVDAVKESLPGLKAPSNVGAAPSGAITTPFGAAQAGTSTPASLPIHRMAKTMWAPMLSMGYMSVLIGLVMSWVWAANADIPVDAIAPAAWTRGLQFFGEGLVLAGIAFLLGSILASLREGGGEIQESLGVTVKTLKMPATAKAFVGLMMLGLMISIVQFFVYIGVATLDDPVAALGWEAWVGPFRELGLGLLLAGIVLALVTLGNVLGFQFHRIRELITEGR